MNDDSTTTTTATSTAATNPNTEKLPDFIHSHNLLSVISNPHSTSSTPTASAFVSLFTGSAAAPPAMPDTFDETPPSQRDYVPYLQGLDVSSVETFINR